MFDLDKPIYNYFLRYTENRYPNVLKVNPEGHITENIKPSSWIKNAFLILSIISLTMAAWVTIKNYIYDFDAQVVSVANIYPYLFTLFTYFFLLILLDKWHEKFHKFFLELKGGECEIISRKGGGEVCIEKTRHSYSRNEYIIGLLTPVLISTILLGLAFIGFVVIYPSLTLYVLCLTLFVFFNLCYQSNNDIYTTILLLKRSNRHCKVYMVIEDLKSDDPCTGFVLNHANNFYLPLLVKL